MATTDIGYAKQKQYVSAGGAPRRRHAVARDDRGLWVTVCTRKPATREYKGWTETVSCQACLEELEEKS